LKPSARITLDGKDITTRLLGGGSNCILESLTITDEAGVKSDSLELSIDNRDGFKAPAIGGQIQVWLGYDPSPAYMGKFRVDEWTKSGIAELA
jgi:phage protein D